MPRARASMRIWHILVIIWNYFPNTHLTTESHFVWQKLISLAINVGHSRQKTHLVTFITGQFSSKTIQLGSFRFYSSLWVHVNYRRVLPWIQVASLWRWWAWPWIASRPLPWQNPGPSLHWILADTPPSRSQWSGSQLNSLWEVQVGLKEKAELSLFFNLHSPTLLDPSWNSLFTIEHAIVSSRVQ